MQTHHLGTPLVQLLSCRLSSLAALVYSDYTKNCIAKSTLALWLALSVRSNLLYLINLLWLGITWALVHLMIFFQMVFFSSFEQLWPLETLENLACLRAIFFSTYLQVRDLLGKTLPQFPALPPFIQ